MAYVREPELYTLKSFQDGGGLKRSEVKNSKARRYVSKMKDNVFCLFFYSLSCCRLLPEECCVRVESFWLKSVGFSFRSNSLKWDLSIKHSYRQAPR